MQPCLSGVKSQCYSFPWFRLRPFSLLGAAFTSIGPQRKTCVNLVSAYCTTLDVHNKSKQKQPVCLFRHWTVSTINRNTGRRHCTSFSRDFKPSLWLYKIMLLAWSKVNRSTSSVASASRRIAYTLCALKADRLTDPVRRGTRFIYTSP